MAIPTSQANARELIGRITKDHGFVSPDRLQQLETFDPELRREIEEALLAKDKIIGSSAITLAKNLYTSKARFIFELLQNADDNTYSQALAAGDPPRLSFRVYPSRIVIECNEDGFNDKNLTAICSIGKSSKTGAQGYIGEKGIGFKSVFMAASKVHIQSGVFSFCFKHKKGDSGMGMISPLWEETNEELPKRLTRFTLFLDEGDDTETHAKTRQSIVTQFTEFQENLLLFMKNIRVIEVTFYDKTSQESSHAIYSIDRPRATYAVLTKEMRSKGTTEKSIKHFHVTTHQATNLAKNENRTYSDSEEEVRAYSTSQIVLAFPLSESYVPIAEPQDLFVFLPVRPVGFKFLIQADFVTDANRQDIVQDSLRNTHLVNSVADAFMKAVLQFCQHDKLRFQWMRYLPDRDTKNMNRWYGLWLSLVSRIEHLVSSTPVLYIRSSDSPQPLPNLCRLQDHMLDELGNPLFYDGKPGKIISRHYCQSDLDILTDYGLPWATLDDVIDWTAKDLNRGTSSRIRSSSMSDDWHSRVSRLLGSLFKQQVSSGSHLRLRLKTLALIPLAGGDWVSMQQAPIYFHHIDDLQIPSKTNLQLVANDVVNADRIELFESLGVETASISLVRESIFNYYGSNDPDLETSKHHLAFLYLTKDSTTYSAEPFKTLKVLNQDGMIRTPHSTYIYILNEEPYGRKVLHQRASASAVLKTSKNYVKLLRQN